MSGAEKCVSCEGSILGMGNPLLDISANVPLEVLQKYELNLNDAIIAQQQHLSIDTDLILNYPVQYIAGGATLNTIRVAQWMMQKPGSTVYFGAVGADSNGNMLEQRATEDGVEVLLQKNADVPTGTCAVLITEQGRSLVANLGAASTFTAAHLETPAALQAVQKAQIVYTSGFFLTVSVESILRVCNSVAEGHKIYAINLPAPFIVRDFSAQLADVLPYADFVFATEWEIIEYGEMNNLGSNMTSIAMALCDLPKANTARPRVVVIFKLKDAASKVVGAVTGRKVAYYPDDVNMEGALVDANGEGDAFIGGFLSQLAQGRSMLDCVRAGKWASEVIKRHSGCTFPKVCTFV